MRLSPPARLRLLETRRLSEMEGEVIDLKARYEELIRKADELEAEAAYLRSRAQSIGGAAGMRIASATEDGMGGARTLKRGLLAALIGVAAWGAGVAAGGGFKPKPSGFNDVQLYR